MPRKMSDAEYRDYRKFQQAATSMRRDGKTESQIGAASRLIDERRDARSLRSEAGGQSLLKDWHYKNPPMNYFHEDDGK